jgi:hypothetical protein
MEEDKMGKMGKTVSYQRPDGESKRIPRRGRARRTRAEHRRNPGVVGTQRPDAGRRRRARCGWVPALVPDHYRGEVALEANEAEHLMQGLDSRLLPARFTGTAVECTLTRASWIRELKAGRIVDIDAPAEAAFTVLSTYRPCSKEPLYAS